MNTEFDVIVIGAGIAGLSAAHCLQAAGKSVCLLDKSQGIGGRMATRRNNDVQWDHGTQYFTAQSPVFRAQVAAWLKTKKVVRWKAPIAVWNGDVLTLTKPNSRYVGSPCMKSPLDMMTENVTLKLYTQVTAIEQKELGWLVRSDLQTWVAKQLVIALPALQAQALLPQQHAANKIAENALMEPCWAVMLSTEISVPLPYGGVFVNQGPLSWIAQDSLKPQRNLQQPSIQNWVLHATTEWSLAHLENSVSEVETLLVAEFNRLLTGWLPASPTPIWKQVSAHRWRYARGAITELISTHVWQEDGLALAGDWLAGGRVEGAYLSGITAAQQLMDA